MMYVHRALINCVLGCNCTLLAEALSAVNKSLESTDNARNLCKRDDIPCSADLVNLLRDAGSNLTDARTYLNGKSNECKCSQGYVSLVLVPHLLTTIASMRKRDMVQ